MKYGRLCVGPTSLMIWQALLVLQWVPQMKVTELYMWQAYMYMLGQSIMLKSYIVYLSLLIYGCVCTVCIVYAVKPL